MENITKITTNAKTPWHSGNNRPVILLDSDDVITACLRGVVKAYNEAHNTNFKTANCDVWDLTQFFNCDLESVMEIFRTPGFFEELAPKKGATKTIKDLIKSTKYDLLCVTATSDEDGSELVEKIKWFKKYIPEFNTKRIIACQDKHFIRGDIIVDDKVENLDSCAPYMQCILMDSPTNKDCKKYIRIHSLKELPDLLEQMFYNENGGVKYFDKNIRPALVKQTNPD